MSARVYVGLGSNTEREANIIAALGEMREAFGELLISPVYNSAAVGFDGSDFLNLVAGFDSELDVDTVVGKLHQIEDQLGRDRSLPKFARRTIDLDILTYDALVRDHAGIQIPRLEILENGFVLKPLQDLAPQTLHPGVGESYSVLWRRMAPHAPPLEVFPLDLG
jgi:2-amino-4-hydroxy-6-hydroxymethyldihydropteridine diphosphokinase